MFLTDCNNWLLCWVAPPTIKSDWSKIERYVKYPTCWMAVIQITFFARNVLCSVQLDCFVSVELIYWLQDSAQGFSVTCSTRRSGFCYLLRIKNAGGSLQAFNGVCLTGCHSAHYFNAEYTQHSFDFLICNKNVRMNLFIAQAL